MTFIKKVQEAVTRERLWTETRNPTRQHGADAIKIAAIEAPAGLRLRMYASEVDFAWLA